VLDEPEIIFARLGADQKMRIVEALIKKKHGVAVTRDGVNDAPALKAPISESPRESPAPTRRNRLPTWC
jgi:hypothetical protein